MIETYRQDGVVVGKYHEGNLRVNSRNLPTLLQYDSRRCPVSKRPLTRRLDDRSVCYRIREGNQYLNNIGSSHGQREDIDEEYLRIRIPTVDIGHQGSLILHI